MLKVTTFIVVFSMKVVFHVFIFYLICYVLYTYIFHSIFFF